jgi:hypothetical protein
MMWVRDHIVGVHLQPLPERSAPSPIVWAHPQSILLHLSFPLSNPFVEVNRVRSSRGYM